MRQPIIGRATTAERSTRGGRRPDAEPRRAGLLRRNAILVSKTPGHEQKLRSLGALSRNGCAVTNVRQEPSLRARLSRLGWRHASLRPGTSALKPARTTIHSGLCKRMRSVLDARTFMDIPGASGTPPRRTNGARSNARAYVPPRVRAERPAKYNGQGVSGRPSCSRLAYGTRRDVHWKNHRNLDRDDDGTACEAWPGQPARRQKPPEF
jgi:hypothetical protein